MNFIILLEGFIDIITIYIFLKYNGSREEDFEILFTIRPYIVSTVRSEPMNFMILYKVEGFIDIITMILFVLKCIWENR